MRHEDEQKIRDGIAAGTHTKEDLENLPLPKIPYVSINVTFFF